MQEWSKHSTRERLNRDGDPEFRWSGSQDKQGERQKEEQGKPHTDIVILQSGMLVLTETDSSTAQPPSARCSSESVCQGGDSSTSTVSAEAPRQSSSCPCVRKRSSRPAHLRRNIRKLLKEHQLDVETQLAQQEERERLKHQQQQRADSSSGPSLVCTNTADSHSGEGDSLQPAHEREEAAGAGGRVLINVNHPVDECDIYLPAHLSRVLKPHQIDGIRFLFDNLVESLQRSESSAGFGCVLAHAMGLGKTLQVIAFIHVLLRHTAARSVLIIVPVNTLQNWSAEFNRWLPSADSLPADHDPDHITARRFKVHILNDEHRTVGARAGVVQHWYRDGGVLLMGYEMYRLLSLKKSCVAGQKKKTKMSDTIISDLEEDLRGIEKALSRPGPDVVICDEGHRIKNCHASTSRALKSIRTRRRVVLTGYPLQNNLQEYWCMVDFVRPNFLGTRQEFSNMFERPILNGQCVDSTPEDLQLMRYRSHLLHSLLEGFVQRRGHDVLHSQLPQKQEHVILVRLSGLQRALYTEFIQRFSEAGGGWTSLNPLKAFCICCKIWNHPDVLYEALQKENLASEQDLDLDDISPNPRCASRPSETRESEGGLSLQSSQVITYEWAKDIMADYRPGILENSAKMVLLFHIIDESVKMGDKVLVFSQSLSTLTLIEDFLSRRSLPHHRRPQTWTRNVNYYRLDGSTPASERERLINQFNDPSNTFARVFLLSTRAGCLGVNLTGANRVVVFDASWNPCHDAQAVCRVYRYGQTKQCHIYRLVCDFTLEKRVYNRQISKQGMSDRVVDGLNPTLMFTRREVESLLQFEEEEEDDCAEHTLQTQEDLDTVIRGACLKYPHLITRRPFQHESLLLEQQDLKLTAAEITEARESYEQEKRASVVYTRPSYTHYYPTSDQSLADIHTFSQRNRTPPARPENPPQPPPVPTIPSCTGHSCKPTVSFPIGCLQKAGVFVQKIFTTRDIVIPSSNSSTNEAVRIRAGESIHVIRGAKGRYIWTCDGRIFAVRAAVKPKQKVLQLLDKPLSRSTNDLETEGEPYLYMTAHPSTETPLDLRGTKRMSDGSPADAQHVSVSSTGPSQSCPNGTKHGLDSARDPWPYFQSRRDSQSL